MQGKDSHMPSSFVSLIVGVLHADRVHVWAGHKAADCAPSSVSVMLTEKKERALKEPPPSPALSAVAQPRLFRSASTLPAPSCLIRQPGA